MQAGAGSGRDEQPDPASVRSGAKNTPATCGPAALEVASAIVS